MTHEERLVQHVAKLQWDDIPEAAREAVSMRLIDTVGVMLAGLKSQECCNLLARQLAWGGAEESSVVGSERRVPAPGAAFLGGVQAHWWEWDDTHDDSALHASAVIFPALLAVAEAANLEAGRKAGREFVTAAVAAFDVACQIGTTLHPHYYHPGSMATGVPGHVGAAAGAAKLLGLDEDGIMSAMGIAAQQAGLSRQPLADRNNGKNILCGIAAGQAAVSAFNAQDGIKGSPNFLTGQYGLNALFANGAADPEAGLAELGTRFSVTETSIKPYPSCRSTHPGLDLTLDMIAEDPQLAQQVETVEATSSQIVYDLCGRPFSPGGEPRVAAQFSIPYTLSVALTRGKVGLADFDPRQVTSDTAVLDLAKRISVQPRKEDLPDSTWWKPYKIRIQLRDGSVREKEITALRGSLARPLLPDEQHAKLAEAGKGVLSQQQLSRLADDARHVGELGIAPVTHWMRAAQQPQ